MPKSSKAFTFAQMATLLLVILGLVVGVVLASTQFRKAGSGISSVGEKATGGVEAAGTSAQGLACELGGGTCKTTSCSTKETKIEADCASAQECCVPK